VGAGLEEGHVHELVGSNNMSGKPTLCPGCHRCNYARGGARSGGDALSAFIICHTSSFTDLDLPHHFLIAIRPPYLASVRQTLCYVGIMGCKVVCLFWCVRPI
jgi:hypothetical protein